MKNITAVLIAVIMLASCKSKQALVAEDTAGSVKSVKEIAVGHSSNPLDFETLQIRANVDYDGSESYNFNADIRIKKDEIIWLNASFLGIPVAKAIITPQNVRYYVSLEKVYFEGDYEMLSNWLGTELDFAKVQNMLLGRAMDNFKEGNYKSSVEDGLYRIQGKASGNIIKDFLFEGANYLLKQQTIAQGGSMQQSITVSYPGYNDLKQAVLPAKLNIAAVKEETVTIAVDYNSINFNKQDLRFTYNVPDNFEQIFIK